MAHKGMTGLLLAGRHWHAFLYTRCSYTGGMVKLVSRVLSVQTFIKMIEKKMVEEKHGDTNRK